MNYGSREFWNQTHLNEYSAGKLDDEEYQRSLWTEVDLQLEGGRRFTMKLVGAGYMRHR